MPTVRCPICEQPFDVDASSSMPFCSDRCRQIDLSRWLDERYSLPVERPEDSDQDELPADKD